MEYRNRYRIRSMINISKNNKIQINYKINIEIENWNV